MTRLSPLKTLTAVAVTSILAACSTTPAVAPAQPAPTPMAAAVEAPKPVPAPVTPAPQAKPAAQPVEIVAAPPSVPAYLDPSSPIYRERQIYFAFDDATVISKYAALLDTHAAFLSKNTKVKIDVEGNTDERGSAEYNLALGQRRADAVVKALELRGVNAAQLEARSWGKLKPVATGSDEDSWARNRRADLVYPDH